MNYLLKSKLNILVVAIFFCGAFSCKVQSKFDRDYPEYTTERNTLEQYKKLNDSTLYINKQAQNKSYGRSAENPVFVGVTNYHEGGRNRERFLNALVLEDGSPVSFERLKSCCPFKTLNSKTIGADQKFGLLDVWIVYPKGQKEKADTLYINAYDQGTPMIPKGYKSRIAGE